MPDVNGYPTRGELRSLRGLADSIPDAASYESVMDAVTRLWWNPEWGIRRSRRTHGDYRLRYRRYHVSTGGWSGNEEIIHVLERTMFWTICWQSSRRGGHYVLDVPQ